MAFRKSKHITRAARGESKKEAKARLLPRFSLPDDDIDLTATDEKTKTFVSAGRRFGWWLITAIIIAIAFVLLVAELRLTVAFGSGMASSVLAEQRVDVTSAHQFLFVGSVTGGMCGAVIILQAYIAKRIHARLKKHYMR